MFNRNLLIAPVVFGLIAGAGSLAQTPGQNDSRAVVQFASRTDTSVALRRMPPIPPAPQVLGQIFERPRKLLPHREGSVGPSGLDPALQGPSSEPSVATTGTSFDGINNVDGVLPPDTIGDIGPNHYVQMVNLSFAIYDRSGHQLYGPANINTLWQGFGGPCETSNDGDPVVLYDHLADRWMMSQFALPNFPRGPFYQCIAVSQTGDPTGSWYRYEFLFSSNRLNDYPKFGVWPDGYYMSTNQYKCNFFSCSWAGEGVVAFERSQMLAGQPARMVYFDLSSVDSSLGGMLPSDLDGPVPPAGAPNYFSQVDDNAWGYSPDQLQIWQFHVDWNNPSSSTFSHDVNLPTAAFDSNLCGYSRNCIPQPGGTPVDALSDRLMYRLQYRNFGSHQTLLVNHTVDVNGSDRAGIRWYELRNTGGGWSIYQQGTFSPDSTHRWMGSIAMNGNGDIGLGYSVSNSSNVYPSIRVTGRLAGDTAGAMTQGELNIVNGSGYQTHSAGRWGDYSMMSVDPTDDCTFWYTQEYYASAGSAPWQTRIGSFKLRDCGSTANNPPVASFTYSCAGLTCSFDGSASHDSDGTISSYSWDFGDGSTGSGPTSSYTYGAPATYSVTLTVTDNGGATGTNTQNVTVQSATTVHVAALTGSASAVGKKKWKAAVTIAIQDASNAAVSGATVSGDWSGGASGSGSCTTDGTGQCSITSSPINANQSSATFTVTGVSISGGSYDPGANVAQKITITYP